MSAQFEKPPSGADREHLSHWLLGLSWAFTGHKKLIQTPNGVVLAVNPIPFNSDEQFVPGEACQYVIIRDRKESGLGPEELVKKNPASAGLVVEENCGVFLFRGASGSQVVYGAWDQNTAILCSNLVFLNGLDLEVSRQSLAWYLRYFYIPAPFTIYDKVSSVLPGHIQGIFAVQKLETLVADPAFFSKEHDALISVDFEDQFERLMKSCCSAAIKDRKGKRGLLLSGGKDSSGLAIAVALLEESVDCLTIGFPKDQYCERSDAESVVQSLGLSGKVQDVLPAMAREQWEQFCKIIGQPMGDPAALPLWCGLTSSFSDYDVILDGTGNDSYFGLTPPLKSCTGWYLKRLLWRLRLDSVFCMAWQRLFNGKFPKISSNAQEFYVSRRGFERNVLEVAFSNGLSWEELPIFDAYPLQETPSGHMTHTVCSLWEPEAAYRKLIQLASVRGLSVRYPYLNPDLREFVQAVPERLRHDKGRNKILLRALLNKHLPERINKKPKGSFVFPLDLILGHADMPYMDSFYRASAWEEFGMAAWWPIFQPVLQAYRDGQSANKSKVYALFVLFSWMMQEKQASKKNSDTIPPCLASLGLVKSAGKIEPGQAGVSEVRV